MSFHTLSIHNRVYQLPEAADYTLWKQNVHNMPVYLWQHHL